MTKPARARARLRRALAKKVNDKSVPAPSGELRTISPGSPEPIEENVPPPADSATFEQITAGKREATRKGIAYALIFILAALVLVGCAGWLIWGDDTSRMQNFSVLFGPVVTLLAGMLGFYFSSEQK